MNRIPPLRLNVKFALAPTAVAVVILMVTLHFFGIGNSMIAPFATLSYMRFLQMRCYYTCMLKHFLIYLVIIAAAFLANLSLPLCIAADIGVFFFLAYSIIDEYEPTNYFPFGMAMIFFQFAPVADVPAMFFRMGALAVSFGIIFLFVLITAPLKFGKDPIRDYVGEGYRISTKLIADCRRNDPEAVSAGQMALREINKKCSEEIYVYNRTAFSHRGMVNYYSRFIILFQSVLYLTHTYDPAQNDDTNLAKAEELLLKFGNMLKSGEPEKKYWNFRFRSGKVDVWDFRFRFAMRQVLVMVPCMAFAYASGFPNISWLPFSLFFMLIPSTDDTPGVVRKRFLGSLFGIAGCLVLFAIFPSLTARIIMTAIFSFLIYSAESYTAGVAYITCATLAMQTLGMSPFTAMWQCLLYTAIGAGIAILANRFLFPIRTDATIQRLLDKLAGIRMRLVEIGVPQDVQELFGTTQQQALSPHSAAVEQNVEVIRTPLSRYVKKNLNAEEQQKFEKDQLTVHSYLIARRIEALDQSLPEERRNPETLLALEKDHMRFMVETLLK